MTWRWRPGRAAIVSGVTGVLLLAALACSSSDPIQSANVTVPVVARTSQAYTGQFQWVRFQVDQITLRPVEAQTNTYLQIPLGLLNASGQVDVRSPTALTVGSAPLHVGTYVVESIRVAQISMNVANVAPTASTGCSDGNLTEVRVSSPIVLVFSNPPLLQVLQDGSAEVNVIVDGPGFVEMLTSQPYACGGEFPTPTPAQLAQVLTVS